MSKVRPELDHEALLVRCAMCKQRPHEIESCVTAAEWLTEHLEEQPTPEQAVIQDDGTYDHISKLFVCDNCYIKIGMPSSRFGWHPTGFISVSIHPSSGQTMFTLAPTRTMDL